MLQIKKIYNNLRAKEFCDDFINSNKPKFIFGRNNLTLSIMKSVDVDGIIDDFTDEKEFNGKPIVPIDNVPNDALVVLVVIMGKPLTAEKRVAKFQFDYLDYFSFYKYSNLLLENIMFWDGVIEDIKENLDKYKWVYSILKDKISKNQFSNIVNFRLSYDLYYMRGFSNRENEEYFEDFLMRSRDGESFVDIGGFDGYTTEKFIEIFPDYKRVFFFEPEEKNMLKSKKRLKKYKNINYYQMGLSDKKDKLRFDVNGSSSKISKSGSIEIEVNKLDDVLIDKEVTFIKMDIEGAEKKAIIGAKEIILKNYPKLAISVYHKKDDFWKIPETILKIRSDYDIYLRHYTEGISETVMFFLPNNKR